ncbi:uncharacterized protein LOC143838646 [Paroedura picta]|uniref:uncharacterized protein LOC143838646 n=1 Tax=Paroedura picta TaxID=143630 RepID=UPI004055C10A
MSTAEDHNFPSSGQQTEESKSVQESHRRRRGSCRMHTQPDLVPEMKLTPVCPRIVSDSSGFLRVALEDENKGAQQLPSEWLPQKAWASRPWRKWFVVVFMWVVQAQEKERVEGNMPVESSQ